MSSECRTLDFTIPGFPISLLWRRLGLPHRIKSWSLTSLQQRLVKYVRHDWLLLTEGHLTRWLFSEMLRRSWALRCREDSGRPLTEDIRRRNDARAETCLENTAGTKGSSRFNVSADEDDGLWRWTIV